MTAKANEIGERSIFLAALEQDTSEKREAYLAAACAGDAVLRERVEALLRSHDDAPSLFAKLAPERIAEELATVHAAGAPNDVRPLSGHGDAGLTFLNATDKPGSLGRLGSYEVEEVIGSGGMGIVLRAFDEKLHRSVAIKVMAPTLATNEHARRRFIREGRAAAAVRDDHVIGIHGVDETNGLPFLVMEYIVGRSLAQRLEADGPLPVTDILRIGGQIARGLAAAHAQGVIHRDIKPANILLENGIERVKITDFGLAHAVDDVRTTQPGTVVGTPEYMSPEQARGERVDHRSDLFSLGCVLYAMCAGRPPFRAESTVAIIRRVCEDVPRPLSEINPDIPAWLAEIIDRLITKSPDERIQTAAEVADLLEQFLAHAQQPSAVPMPAVMGGRSSRRVLTHQKGSAGASPSRPHRWSIAIAALLLLTATLALAETTGVTSVAATVIRIVRGDGTLVVEVDDPNIQVLVDGEELVINGAGPKEIRLRPGQHELHTLKDGRPVETKLVTITRDGRQVVKVAHKPSTPAPARPNVRLVMDNVREEFEGMSPDGRYFLFTDWDTGDVAVHELATGKVRPVTNIGGPQLANGFALQPFFSADGTQFAFTWNYRAPGDARNNYQLSDLRVVSFLGGEPRVVFDDKEKYAGAEGWSPDGKWILASLNGDQERQELAQVGVSDKSVRVFHTIDKWRTRKLTRARLSPDGKTVAYTRLANEPSPHGEIFLVDVESGQETQLNSHTADKHVLGWTADGRLLYDVERQGSRDAWLIRVVGSKPHGEARLVKKDLGTISPLGISHSGTLFYVSSSRRPSLYVGTLDIENSSVTIVPLPGEQFNILEPLFLNDWSPDGEYLAYSARLLAGTPRKQEMRILSMKAGLTRAFDLKPDEWINRYRWSPDGQSFIGPSRWKEASIGIDRIDAASGEATTVVERGSRPVWARNGRGIFYFPGSRTTEGPHRIVHRDLESQTERDVWTIDHERASGYLFEPSPDGRQVAVFGRPDRETQVLWLVPIDGGPPRELYRAGVAGTSVGPYDRVLAWTPDGRYLIFNRRGNDEQSGLWYIAADGGEARKLLLSGRQVWGVSVVSIHPDGKQLALSVSGTGKSEIWALENFLPPPKADQAAKESPASATKMP